MTVKAPITGESWRANLQQAFSIFNRNRHFLFSAYQDADALGTMLSLALYLQVTGKQVALFLPVPLKTNLVFLREMIHHNDIRLVAREEDLVSLQTQIDTVVFCDTANAALVPYEATLTRCFLEKGAAVIEIDHHFGTDSAAIAEGGVHLFREANACTEIAAEILQEYHRRHPEYPHPFEYRNIVVSLLTGLLADTGGGNEVFSRKDFEHWSGLLGGYLKGKTRSFPSRESRNGSGKIFGNAGEITAHLHHLSPQQQSCIRELRKHIVRHRDIGELNMLNSSLARFPGDMSNGDSGNFSQIWDYMANVIPQEGGKLGLFYFNGTHSGKQDCIFLKIRRAGDFNKYDLRETEPALKNTFAGDYMGGGGHAGAVSFRIRPMSDREFLPKVAQMIRFLEEQIHE
ncbi:MAG: hypothetical protein GWM98_26125 [Nitrospinaceae bacterium]|nr:hypothetical protein [Nitrospinaceae bacterium]NIR57310.1 hypothetical protein [Nitrospinaceae bacterium]NIS87762.1 hypothetical protein [Nitrospinaceae bacterium]NIT84632.1 hypothetical protein [Nitrospinaceae bacterium]NIU46811.1 hypothetical protein [Nitrospinaceae bacterium]